MTPHWFIFLYKSQPPLRQMTEHRLYLYNLLLKLFLNVFFFYGILHSLPSTYLDF